MKTMTVLEREEAIERLEEIVENADKHSERHLREKLRNFVAFEHVHETYREKWVELRRDLEDVAEEATRIKQEGREKEEELQEEYGMEICERHMDGYSFNHDGEMYSGSWDGEIINGYSKDDDRFEEDIQAFVKALSMLWEEATDEMRDVLEEKFRFVSGGEMWTVNMREFELYMPIFPTSLKKMTVKVKPRLHLDGAHELPSSVKLEDGEDQDDTVEVQRTGGIDFIDLIGEECPECGVEMTSSSLRWNGEEWEHKNPNVHAQAGHHVFDARSVVQEGENDGSDV